MLRYAIIPVTPFAQNCSLLWCDETLQAAVVDPGGDLPRIEAAIAKHGVKLTQILLTHGHIDHVGGCGDLAQKYALPIEGPQREEAFWLDALSEQGRMFGFPAVSAVVPTRWLDDGDTIHIGNQTLSVIHCPGHTPGHVVFYSAAAKLAIVGDVLFAGSIGRTDFPRGDHASLIHAIRNKLFPLGDDIDFIPGHGPMSDFGTERRSNPYVADSA
ncbi:MBL fold metallo-hydrolase [Uliginosibacterium sediminicola]|uniref:MBL fold metallo-hydrolase n=1 Tax=Uliginosibacterium sediminicola TaxID=2024550 RepID=A0ABU9YV16_9RHOO